MNHFNFFCYFSLISVSVCFNFHGETGMMGKIKAGFEIAGKYLGLDQTSKIAQMVSQTFSGKTHKENTQGNNANIFSGFLRLLGLDSKKISAIAINAIIFIAQLISSTLTKPAPSQITEARTFQGTPLDWMLNNSNIADMLDNVKDRELSDSIVEYIKEKGLDEDTDCIQMLLCKTAPLIWGMQKTVNGTGKNAPKGKRALFANLPTIEEFASHGDICEKQHRYCLIHY